MGKIGIGFVGILAVALLVLSGSVFTVKETQQVLVLQFGDVKGRVTDPGLHFKIPVVQQLRIFEKRILNVDPPAEEVLLADQKRLVVDTFARYRIADMLKYYQTLSTEAAAVQRMNNIINASLRGVLGKTTLQNVLSVERDRLMKDIQEEVNTETDRFGIEIVDVRIVRADLPVQVTQSTYNRMRSEREREAKEARAQGEELALKIRSEADKERTIMLSEARRDSEILRGEGDKEAIRIYAKAFGQDPQFYEFYRTMEAYKKALINGGTTMVLSPDSDFFKFIASDDGKVK
ncbi:MAG: protease modulator HflC [Pseudomonadota bacterium]|jgi:membrane protease subunit HflC|nr:HflC protein [Alphaproteobacteria bacterium]MEC7701454.1 protease modulator HflC [Pseudomonadota bacterium]MED5422960.1 protease modulator HflC [Pseudomonadota bacterium]|tara:strand:- start:75314 stop:76186 length:873 start_codon:yes stop_codon:yes gene_type:complete